MKKKVAVILLNLGGPDKLESVEPFLFNLFNDKAIINLPFFIRFFVAKLISKLRKKKATKIYQQMNGKSPIVEITQTQAHKLERELSFFGDYKVFVAMRYWHPFSYEVIEKVLQYQPDEVVLLPLYPQFSTATTKSSFDDFLANFPDKKTKVNKVYCYYDKPDFIKAHSLMIKKTLEKNVVELKNLRFLFSAHGLPQKLIDQGDPYVYQIEKSVQLIVEDLVKNINFVNENVDKNNIDFCVCYQSKVGPMKWTGPSLETEIRKVALDNKIPVIIPISFVSEHSETLVELDIEYYELAKELGIKNYIRVPALNDDGYFIKALVEICKEEDWK